MELIDLRVFASIAENRTATAAARLLGMTQPGVSQHLARLEDELGARLFEREGKKLVLNDFGSRFLGRAKNIIGEIDNLKDFSSESAAIAGELKIAITGTSAFTAIPSALQRFKKCNPNIQVKMDLGSSETIEEGVIRGHYDLGVVTDDGVRNPMLDKRILCRDRMDAVVPRAHVLSSRKTISMEELVKWPVLTYPKRSVTRQMVDKAFYKARVYPQETIDVYLNNVAVKLAGVGMGVALLPYSFIKNEVSKRKFCHIRIKGDPFVRSISVIKKSGAHLCDAAGCFYNVLLSQKHTCLG